MFGMIFFCIIALILVVFIGVNLNNLTTVSLIFRTFENLPVFMPIFFAFCLGFLTALFLCLSMTAKPKKKKTDVPKPKKHFFAKKSEPIANVPPIDDIPSI